MPVEAARCAARGACSDTRLRANFATAADTTHSGGSARGRARARGERSRGSGRRRCLAMARAVGGAVASQRTCGLRRWSPRPWPSQRQPRRQLPGSCRRPLARGGQPREVQSEVDPGGVARGTPELQRDALRSKGGAPHTKTPECDTVEDNELMRACTSAGDRHQGGGADEGEEANSHRDPILKRRVRRETPNDPRCGLRAAPGSPDRRYLVAQQSWP